jgi:pyruvate,water dikinase
MLAPENVYPRTIATAEEFIAQVQANAQATQDLAGRLRSMRQDLARAEDTFLAVIPTALPILGAVSSLDRWLVEWLGEKPGAALQLLRGLPNNVTTEMDLKLWAAAQRIRSDTAARETMRSQPVETLVQDYMQRRLPETAQRVLEEFLQKYGMRAVGEIDIGHPRWRDDPTPILQTLRGYLELQDPDRAPDVIFRRNRQEAERLAIDYVARIRRTRFGWLRARLVGGIIRRMRALSGLREVPLFYMVRTLDLYRTAWLDGARELVAQGELESSEDIFFVPIDQLEQLALGQEIRLKHIVAVHRAEYERERMRKQMPHILFSTGEAFYEGVSTGDSGDIGLAGEAVSPGVVEGRARVLFDPRAARLEPGEILVCPSTDPGWTPLFLTAAGLVMEIGGMITHGSVVAREYGIPAVVGVHQATTRIETGRRVRVDGNRGRVTILD